MTPEQEKALLQRIAKLESRLDTFDRVDRFSFLKNIEVNKPIGTRFGTDAKQKLSFWGALPVIQFADPLGRLDTSGSSGTSMTTGHRFNGNVGTDYYSVGDLVYALKLAGIVKNQ